jgi:hypothetical protein
MSHIHYFQRYSQKENVVTNNTLLLLSRLNRFNSQRFQGFLSELLEEAPPVEVGVTMEQQKKTGDGSVPDGFITQESFKIVIESKLHEAFSVGQLQSHLNTFEEESLQILICLSPSFINETVWKEVTKSTSEFNVQHRKQIIPCKVTFENIVRVFKNNILPHEDELRELIEDFEGFCIDSNLLPLERFRLRALTSGWSLEENFKYGIYYDHISRGFQKHRYLGLYHSKSIVGIGEVENIVTVELINDTLTVLSNDHPVTDEQKERITGIIHLAWERNDWDIARDHRFFIVPEFYPTNFKKVTKFPIQRSRYFDLRDELEISEMPSVATIAELLAEKEWE